MKINHTPSPWATYRPREPLGHGGPIRIGIVGFGEVASNAHVPALHRLRDDYTIAAVADPTPQRRVAAQEALGLDDADLYDQPAELIGRADIDAVLVAVPPGFRAPIVEAACAAGHHVLAEKPLSAEPRAARQMVQSAEAVGRHLAIVHNYLFFPEIEKATTLISEGAIGDVRHVNVTMLGVEDGNASGWRGSLATSGGGVLMDMLHGVYLAFHLAGEEPVVCSGIAKSYRGGNVEDIALASFAGTNTTASVSIGWGLGPGGIQIVGASGRISISYLGEGTPPFQPFERLTVTTRDGAKEIPVTAVPARESFVELYRDFAVAVRRGGRPRATGADGLAALEGVVATYASAVLGRAIQLPLGADDPLLGGPAALAASAPFGSLMPTGALFHPQP